MLINFVKDSVMNCFCHTCNAPLLPAVNKRQAPIKKVKTKPRTKQPKKVKFITTEIRCQEKSRGGLCYEVILAEPTAAQAVPKRAGSPNCKNVSVEDIEGKLRAAEERRLNLEANKIAALTAKWNKIEEASRKKDEQTCNFILSTREALENKMETHIEKREAYINDLKSKLKDHLENVEKNRLALDQQTNEVRNAMQEKLETVKAHRDENIKKMLDRLKEHEDQAQRVRSAYTEKLQQLETTINDKLDQAKTRRVQLEKEQKEKLRNHNTVKIAEVRNSIESQEVQKTTVTTKVIETKLTTAEQNRTQEIQKKLDNIKKQERRAELVRQNKAALASQGEDAIVTASSG